MKYGLKAAILAVAAAGLGSTLVYAQASDMPPDVHESPPVGVPGDWGEPDHYLFEAQCTGPNGSQGAAIVETSNLAMGRIVSGTPGASVQVQIGCDFGPPIGETIIWRPISAWQSTRGVYNPLPVSCGYNGGSLLWVQCRVAD